jgi:hypothetical protein
MTVSLQPSYLLHLLPMLLALVLEPDLDLPRGETNSFGHFLPLPRVWELCLRDAHQQDIDLKVI